MIGRGMVLLLPEAASSSHPEQMLVIDMQRGLLSVNYGRARDVVAKYGLLGLLALASYLVLGLATIAWLIYEHAAS